MRPCGDLSTSVGKDAGNVRNAASSHFRPLARACCVPGQCPRSSLLGLNCHGSREVRNKERCERQTS